MTASEFQTHIRAWYRHHGRHGLPWRKTRDPYRILVSEVMLQQTQVSRVLRKYPEFLRAFPDMPALARAPLAKILNVWQGMGYNRRAVYLKRLATAVVRDYGGEIPSDPAVLRRLPGIGPATAGAIGVFAFRKRVAFLETNIRRVYILFFFKRRRRVKDREILHEIQRTLPGRSIHQWYWALMDYGALALKHVENPNRRSAGYATQPAFTGSRRELRGQILAAVVHDGPRSINALQHALTPTTARDAFRAIIRQMAREGLIAASDKRVLIPR